MFQFYKYQGTGNDFIIIDNRNLKFDCSGDKIKKICDKKFGIGADGLILLQNQTGYDFEMKYFNADGNEGTMCGNGGRCIVEFSRTLNLIEDKTIFLASDGPHTANICDDIISLKMNDVNEVEINSNYFVINTGSPHYVVFVNDLENYDVNYFGKKIRFNERFKKEGINVNFVEKIGNELFVRTYERGVETETLSCGTGVTATALIHSLDNDLNGYNNISVKTLGGNLNVKFIKHSNNSFSDIWLEGPATFVFKGELTI